MARPVLLAVLFAIITAVTVDAHNWLTRPEAFNRQFKTSDCRGAECTNACPEILLPDEMRNTIHRPAEEWKRGQTVKIAWARNNHHGGMMRISLVPVPKMNVRGAHARFALQYGCWESGEYECAREGDSCGTDVRKRGYRRFVTIPSCFVDGDYVLGYVWYGGLHFKKKHGQFPDFYSCSFVRISGGAPVGGSYSPQWVPGNGDKVVGGRCLTSSTSVGLCGNRGCRSRKAFYGIASIFKGGPAKKFTQWDVRRAFREGQTNELQGLCREDVCCKKRCGSCGGPNCSRLPGGGSNCCFTAIKRSGRSCTKYPPPCRR